MPDKIFSFDNIDLETAKLKKDPTTGYLVGDAYITSTGVFPYTSADGSKRYELRHPDDVFQQNSLDSLKLIPITREHPNDLLDSSDTKYHQVGMVGENVRKAMDGKRVIANIKITDSQTISDIENKIRTEVSAGYWKILSTDTGVFEGQSFTHRQTNIEYNHAAVTKKGRLGPKVAIAMDSKLKDNKLNYSYMDKDKKNNNGGAMPDLLNISVDSVSYPVPPQVKVHVDKLETEIINKNTSLDSVKEELKEVKKSVDTLTAQLDEANEKLEKATSKDHSEEINKLAIERANLISEAVIFVDDKTSLDSLSNVDIKKEVIKKARPKVSLDSKSDEYISARYDAIIEDSKDSEGKFKEQLKKTTQKVGEESVDALETAREKYNKNLYRNQLEEK